MDKQESNKWIEDVMHSLEGIQSAPSNPMLYFKVTDRLANVTAVKTKNKLKPAVVAAAAALVVLLNTVSIVHFKKKDVRSNNSDTYEMVSEALDHSININL